jgi:hypothetical protein
MQAAAGSDHRMHMPISLTTHCCCLKISVLDALRVACLSVQGHHCCPRCLQVSVGHAYFAAQDLHALVQVRLCIALIDAVLDETAVGS